MFRFATIVEYRHPETDELQQATVVAEDQWALGELEKHTCTLQKGDYISLVGLPGKIDKTLRIFGFLGLDPDREYLLKKGQPLRGVSPFTASMIAFLIAGIVWLIMAFFDVVMFSFPTGGDWKLPVGLVVGGLFLGGLIGLVLNRFQKEEERTAGNALTAFWVCGFFGAIGAPLLLIILNSRLDKSESKLEPIEIINFWQTTHNLMIADYEVEYRPLRGGATEKRHVRYSLLERMGDAEFGVLEHQSGRFGYPWVRGVHPFVWREIGSLPEILGPTYHVAYVEAKLVNEAGDEEPMNITVKPLIELDDGELLPAPKELISKSVARLEQGGFEVELQE